MKNSVHRISILCLVCIFGGKLAMAQEGWTLRRCVEYAIIHNVNIKKQQIVRDQQAVELNTARLSRLPDLNGSASHTFNFGRGLNDQNTYTDRNTQQTSFYLNTNVPLFTGMQIPNNIALNRLNLQAATADLNKAKEDISIQVTSSFLQVLFNEELYRVALGQVTLSKEQLERIERLNELGKVAVSEVYEAKARLAQDELSAVQADNNRQLSLLDLSQLLELSTPEGFSISSPQSEPDFLVPASPEDIFNQAVMIKPGILAEQYRLAGTARNIRIAQSAYYPQLSFGAGLNTSYYKISGWENDIFGRQLNNNFSKYVGVTLSVPLFNRMQTRNRVRTARLQQLTQALQLEESKKSLYKEIQQAYYNAVAARSKYTSSQAAEQANEAAFRLMAEKYDNGKATAVEYNEIKLNWMKAVSDRIQAKYDYIFRIKILDFYKGADLDLI